jgi:hypothetical protein
VGRSAIIVVAVALVALFLFTRHPIADNGTAAPVSDSGGTTTGHLKVIPTIRSVTVSPGSVNFGDCTGGSGYTDSTQGAMGYPNGGCSVGAPGVNASYPITVTYTGIPGDVYVSGSDAVPSDSGTNWTLCSPQGSPGTVTGGATTCSGGENGLLPGVDQYMVMNFAPQVSSATVLTTTPECDMEFDSGGGCAATPAEFKNQVQREGLLLTGPKTWDDHSESWTITVTWTAVGASS